MSEITVAAMAPEDIPEVLGLIREFAAYENLLEYCEVDQERLDVALFSVGATAEALVARDGERMIGYAFFYPSFSSFRGQRGFYLEDIYVSEEYRGRGVGASILRELARLAATRGSERIDFLVLDWNTPAIGFYKRLGAVQDDSERHFKLVDDVFRDLAR